MRIPCLLLGLALLHGGAAPASASRPAAPMSDRPGSSAVIEDRDLALHVQFDFAAATRVLRVRYALDNRGPAAVAAFDRGDTLALARHALEAGAVAAPLREARGDALTLGHRALPLPRPAPTVPRQPLAARVEAGARLEGAFSTDVDPGIARVRHCLGVAAFDPALFSMPQRTASVEIWRASFDAAGRQRLLCTPWFDLARGAFDAR
jgi:hypothetical protein